MEDIALTNTLLDIKTNIYDDCLNLTNNNTKKISSNNNSNNNNNNQNNNYYHNQRHHNINSSNTSLISNPTSQQAANNLSLILLRKNKKTNSHLKFKYNLPVEIIDYDNLNLNHLSNFTTTTTTTTTTSSSATTNSNLNLNSTLNTSTTDINQLDANSTNMNANNKMIPLTNKSPMLKQQQQNTLTTVSETNPKQHAANTSNSNIMGQINSSNSTLNRPNHSNNNSNASLMHTQLLPNQGSEKTSFTPISSEPHFVPPKKLAAKVTSRIVFLKLGQIDTRNERYDAEAYIECSWEDDQIFKILADPNMTKNSKPELNKRNVLF